MTYKRVLAGIFSAALLGVGLAAAPSTAHAAPGNVTVEEIDETIQVPARQACAFPVTVVIKATLTSYDAGRQHIEIFDGQPSTVTNPANNKVFNLTGDGAFVDNYNGARTRTNSVGTGVQLFWGDIDLPGSQAGREIRPRMIYTTANTRFQLRDVKRADGGWLKFQEIGGRYIDVCRVIR